MDNSDTIHKLADTTYRNVDELAGNLKKLLSVAKSLSKAMEDVIPLSEEFNSIIDSIGSKTANLPGGVRNLGVSLKEMATANRKISASFADWTTSVNTDLVVPLEDKLDREHPDIMKSWKGYKAETSKKETAMEKTSVKLKGIRKKKSTMDNREKETQLCQILDDQQHDLHSTRVEGLRKALIEQQKLFSFFIFHLCGVHHSHIAYASTTYQTLSMKVNSWTAITSTAEELPQESLVLLKNPHSPDAYKLPEQERPSFDFEELAEDQLPASDTGRIRVGSVKGFHDLNYSSEPKPVTAADIRNIKADTQVSPHLKRRTSCRVKVVHSFDTQEQGRLNLKMGDLIDAVGEEKDGWMYGVHSATKESGWFPSQYVDKVWAPTPELGPRKIIATPKATSLQVPDLPERDYISKQGTSPVISRRKINPTQPSQLSSSSAVPVPPTPAQAPPPPAPPQNNPPKKQLSFSDMIKQRANRSDDSD